MRTAVVTALMALAFAGSAAAAPNVVLIVTDDQRWDTLAYMPTVQAELVGKGVTFSNAFAVNPLCCPSRASILTGTYSHTNGVWANGGRGYANFNEDSTLPVWLDSVGYQTMLIGKYLNGYWPPLAVETHVPPGWDHWFARWLHPQLYFDWQATNGETVFTFGSEPADYATDVNAAEAVRFIRESGPDPFFLYFAPKAPHVTNGGFSTDPAPRHVDAFAGLEPWLPPSLNEPDIADKPRHLRSLAPIPLESLTKMREEQLESLLAVDEAVAQMLAALEETGKLADTLIVFMSDNGQGWGEHRWAKKSVPYEESIRVPLVARYDRLGGAGRVEPRFALNVDLAPTISQAAGISVEGVEGRSLLPLLAGGPTRWRTSFLLEHFDRPRQVPAYCGFRGSRWKYVQYATGEEELYDLRVDPYELRNQAERNRRSTAIIGYRKRVARSACRPPDGFRPLPECTRTGTAGPDRIRGTRWRDWICAGRGRDRINVLRGGRDVVRCGPGVDRVRANRRDRLIGCEIRLRG